MPTRDERQAEAEKHVSLMRGVFATETAKAIESAVVYEDGSTHDLPLPSARFESTKISVRTVSLEEALAHVQGKACVIDPASYRFPGSGFMVGSWNAEAALCSTSNLYPVLEGLRNIFYQQNRSVLRGGLYSSRALYLDEIVFVVDGTMRPQSVIVCAPPNRKDALRNHRPEAECDGDLTSRIQTVMNIAAVHEATTVVAPAFGCGMLGNDPTQVAQIFKSWLDEHPNMFETVIFAVAKGRVADAFTRIFTDTLSGSEIEASPSTDAPTNNENSANKDDSSSNDWRNYMVSSSTVDTPPVIAQEFQAERERKASENLQTQAETQ